MYQDLRFQIVKLVVYAAIAGIWLASPADAQGQRDPGMKIVAGKTALLITDPHNDFLNPKGVARGVAATTSRSMPTQTS